jgi:ammonia channel protein AmtB
MVRKKYVIFLIVTIVVSLVITFIAMGIIGYNICFRNDNNTPSCYGGVFYDWFLPVFGISFVVLLVFSGLVAIRYYID